jgi:hypothetical protein
LEDGATGDRFSTDFFGPAYFIEPFACDRRIKG